jgi:acyl homoserine lactone synthase
MIEAITLETAHLLGDALPSSHRLRHRIFVERQRYQVSCWRGMEWDQFDTPAAVYLLWRDPALRVRAVARLIPTSVPYMIQQLWPELLESGEIPVRNDIWEVTRFGIDRDLEPAVRVRIFGEMFCAFAEFGLKANISEFIFVTPSRVIDSALTHAGVEARRLSLPRRLGGLPVVAARSAVSHDALMKLRRHHQIPGPVLRIAGEEDAQAA